MPKIRPFLDAIDHFYADAGRERAKVAEPLPPVGHSAEPDPTPEQLERHQHAMRLSSYVGVIADSGNRIYRTLNDAAIDPVMHELLAARVAGLVRDRVTGDDRHLLQDIYVLNETGNIERTKGAMGKVIRGVSEYRAVYDECVLLMTKEIQSIKVDTKISAVDLNAFMTLRDQPEIQTLVEHFEEGAKYPIQRHNWSIV